MTVRTNAELLAFFSDTPVIQGRYTPLMMRELIESFNVTRSTVINVKDAPYFAVGDNVADDTVALQAAFDAAIAANLKVFMPLGDYKTTKPLLAMRFVNGVFSNIQLTIEGQRATWNGAGTYQRSTRILPTFNDTFALGIQNARAIRIKDVTIEGQNDFSANISADNHELQTNANYVINSCRDSRYSPYSGICVDPFGTSVPADGGYPGFTSYYAASAGGSASMEFEGVKIRGFVANFMICPNGTLGLESEITFRDCKLEYAKVNVAIGQTQSRNLYWYGGSSVVALYGFDGNSYGARTGCPIKIFGCNMSGKYLFNFPQTTGSPLLGNAIHAESFYSIGFLGSSFATSRAPMKFTGCLFSFGNFGAGPHADRHVYTLAPLHFDSCSFINTATNAPKVFRIVRDNSVPIRFTNCLFNREVQNEFTLAPSTNGGTILMDDLHFDSNILLDGGARGNSTGNDRISHRLFVTNESNINGTIVPFGTEINLNSASAVADRKWSGPNEGSYQVNHGSLAVTVNGDGTAVFTVPDATVVRTGDLVYSFTAMNVEKFDGTVTDSMPLLCLGVITGINVSDVTIDGCPQNLVAASYSIRTFWWPRYHQASVGDTSTSVTIANVTNPTAWKIGNKIRGSGIPTGTYITNIVTTTFTLSKATTSSLGGTRLYDADIYKITGTAV